MAASYDKTCLVLRRENNKYRRNLILAMKRKSLIDELRAEDAKINKRIDKVQRNSRAIIELLMERHKMYLKYESMAADITTRFNISTRREDIFLEVMIYKVKADMEDDMAQIFTRLDDLETKIQALTQPKAQK